MAKKVEKTEEPIEEENLDEIDLVGSILGDDSKIEAISANDVEVVDPSRMISTSLIPLDFALGGGITKGRSYEISGPESHGKSTLCDSIVASWLQKDKHALCLRIESESTMDKIRCQMIGVDLNRVMVFETNIMEEGYDQIAAVQEKVYSKYGNKVPLLIIWDTLTAAAPRVEIETDNSNGGGMMANARINSRELRKLNGRCAQYDHAAIIIQQVREDGTDGYGHTKYKTTGGQALKHYLSSRLFVKRRAPIFKDNNSMNDVIGYEVEIQMLKNKITGISRPIPLVMNIMEGFDRYGSAALFALENNRCAPFIVLKGAWVKIIDHKNNEMPSINGAKKLAEKLKTDPYLMKLVEYAAYYNKSAEHELFRVKYETLLKKLYMELDELYPKGKEKKDAAKQVDSSLNSVIDNLNIEE